MPSVPITQLQLCPVCHDLHMPPQAHTATQEHACRQGIIASVPAGSNAPAPAPAPVPAEVPSALPVSPPPVAAPAPGPNVTQLVSPPPGGTSNVSSLNIGSVPPPPAPAVRAASCACLPCSRRDRQRLHKSRCMLAMSSGDCSQCTTTAHCSQALGPAEALQSCMHA